MTYSVAAIVEGIKDMYTPTIRTWSSVEELAEQTKWLHLTSQTAAEYMTEQGVSELFIHELQEALTRVNYGQVLSSFTFITFLSLR